MLLRAGALIATSFPVLSVATVANLNAEKRPGGIRESHELRGYLVLWLVSHRENEDRRIWPALSCENFRILVAMEGQVIITAMI